MVAAKLLGQYLLDFTEITPEDIEEALDEQVGLRQQGAPTLIGEIMVQLGMVTPEELQVALEQQARDRDTTPEEARDYSKPFFDPERSR